MIVAAAFIPCLLVSSVCAAATTSTLVMLDDNVITGWVKGLDQGKLSFGTDDLGTLSVNWDRVATITSSGRYRAQLNSYWRQEIVIDFFFELSLYGTYDSQPPEGALQTSDYGLVTSIGYSFWP